MSYQWNQKCRDGHSHIFDIFQDADNLVTDDPNRYDACHQKCKWQRDAYGLGCIQAAGQSRLQLLPEATCILFS